MKPTSIRLGQASTHGGQNALGARRSLLTALALLLVLFGAGLWLLHTKPGHRPGTTAAAPAIGDQAAAAPGYSPVRSAPALAPVTLGLSPGLRLTYGFEQDRLVVLKGGSFGGMVSQDGSSPELGLRVTQQGRLVLRVLEEQATGWWVGFACATAAVRMVSGDSAVTLTEVEAGLEAEILAFVEKSGRVGRMLAPGAASPDVLNHWRDLLSRWQIVLPEDVLAARWTATEEDSTGSYRAEYTWTSRTLPKTAQKEKARYLSLNGTGKDGLLTRNHLSGLARIDLDPYPTRVEGRERLTVLTPEIGGQVTTEVAYRLAIEGATRDGALAAEGRAEVQRFEANGVPFAWQPTPAAHRPEVVGDTALPPLDEQLDHLESLLAEGKNGTSAELKVLETIAAWLRKDDAAVDAVLDRLSQGGAVTNQPLSSALLGMLGAAGTPKAQRALIGVAASGDWPMDARGMAIFSFAQVTEPMPEVEGWLRQLHARRDELSNSSLLVLAAMGDRVRSQDAERFGRISEYVLGAAGAAGPDGEHQIVGLEAIGNLGPDQVPEVVRTALGSETVLVRERALQSLKRIADPEAGSLVRRALQGDSSESVRAVAAGVLSDPNWQDGYADLAFAATQDPAESVRSAAVQALGGWMEDSAEAVRLVQQVAQLDASPEVREAAAQVLNSRTTFEVAAGDGAPPGPR
jgi:HEAT repeat protein